MEDVREAREENKLSTEFQYSFGHVDMAPSDALDRGSRSTDNTYHKEFDQ